MEKTYEQLARENDSLHRALLSLQGECHERTLQVHQLAKLARRVVDAGQVEEARAGIEAIERVIAEGYKQCRAAERSAAWRELVNMIEWQPARHQAEQARQRLEFDQQVKTKTDM